MASLPATQPCTSPALANPSNLPIFHSANTNGPSKTPYLLSAAPPPNPDLCAAWAAADALFTREVTPAHALTQPISLRRPFLFYLGHLPAFALNTARLALPRSASAASSLPPPAHFDDLFSRGIDPDVEDPASCHANPGAPLVWPEWAAVAAYRDTARAAIVAARLPAATARLIAEHDFMHVETLYYMLAQLAAATGRRRRVDDGHLDAATGGGGGEGRGAVQWLVVPAGEARLGRARAEDGNGEEVEDAACDGEGAGPFGWDNEFPAAAVRVEGFVVARDPVTIAEYAGFVEHGGYAEPRFWRPEDWAWVKREAVRCPASWRAAAGGGWDVVTVDGLVSAECVVGSWPVSVSLAEARAYAVFAGARLLSEAEWDRAACGDGGMPWEGEGVGGVHGNFGGWARRPVAVGAVPGRASWVGAREMFGNGWELVEQEFRPLPGFRAMRLYPQYSADFFDDKHFVLKGASWMTDGRLVRRSFRNFYQARYPYVFSKFRLARDAE